MACSRSSSGMIPSTRVGFKSLFRNSTVKLKGDELDFVRTLRWESNQGVCVFSRGRASKGRIFRLFEPQIPADCKLT